MVKEKIGNREKTQKEKISPVGIKIKTRHGRNNMNQLIKDYSNDEEVLMKIEKYISSLNLAN